MATGSAAVSKHREGNILVASPRAEWRSHILRTLPKTSGHATEASGGADALLKLASADFRTLVLDPELDDLDAEELVATVRRRYPHLQVIVLDRERAVEAPASDFPGSLHELADSLDGSGGAACAPPIATAPAAIGSDPDDSPVNPGNESSAETALLPGLIGCSPELKQVCRLARLVAARDTPVLVMGATGTGKELVARGIHALSLRARAAFSVVNCAAIPESLLEAELFGFARGAFTGAFQSHAGRIHAAHGGTLLLDEVGELPLSMQAKLLRFVQEGEVQRLGSTESFRADVRLIAATNADLRQCVRQKQFREDLYYRLAVFPLELPPLRDRGEDILPLAQYFLDEFCHTVSAPRKTFGAAAARLLCEHSWPGNVRELRHVVERAFILSDARPQIWGEDLKMFSEPK